jgi:predicted lactoylglutathione lyase
MHDRQRKHICDAARRELLQDVYEEDICDATRSTEVLVCLSCDSRANVDDLVAKARDAGGTVPSAPKDYGFMYGHGFEDLDGHIWELVYMEPTPEVRV